MDISSLKNCVMSRSAHCVIDLLKEDGRTVYCNETPEQVKLRYPDAVVMPVDEAAEIIQQSFIDDKAKEITEEAFWEAYETLPPLKSIYRNGNHTFMFSEFYSGIVTSIYAHIGSRFYTFHDKCTLTHAQIIAKCLSAEGVDPLTVECDCV